MFSKSEIFLLDLLKGDKGKTEKREEGGEENGVKKERDLLKIDNKRMLEKI
jgi:hypothetical protein